MERVVACDKAPDFNFVGYNLVHGQYLVFTGKVPRIKSRSEMINTKC